ncbi:histidine kinase dimerization/phosphoacceptor domain-containing protein, partial [Streptomyces brasiliscabiei]|uniref:histidine kinase dimerization/phosphoacceptor domain-containing protein n=1 Tax=Streptomyces brasiliscabiei TaxID=2736302 RepID=UPI0030152DE6
IRFRVNSRLREKERAKLREREQLARELHDTVAHYVSAIVIRAQAGRALAASRPDAAVDALAVIEEAASRTLAEMRTMVGVLRRG